MEENYIYQLENTIEYSKGGEFVKTGEIEFRPPDISVFDESSDFEQIIMGSIMSAAKSSKMSDEIDEDKKMEIPTPYEIRMLLFVSQEIKVKDIATIFKKLVCKTATFDGETKLKMDHFKKFSKDDFLNMMCGYANFFSFPSLLKGG